MSSLTIPTPLCRPGGHPSRTQPPGPSAGSKMEQLSGLQLQKLILNKGDDCRSEWGRVRDGEGCKGQRGIRPDGCCCCSGYVAQEMGRLGEAEKGRGRSVGPRAVHLSALLVLPRVKFFCLSLAVSPSACISELASLTLPVSLRLCGSCCDTFCPVFQFPHLPVSLAATPPGSLCISEPPRLPLGVVFIIRSTAKSPAALRTALSFVVISAILRGWRQIEMASSQEMMGSCPSIKGYLQRYLN